MGARNGGGAREAILDATLELLGEPDGATASLALIATRSGYSRQAIYRHFGSRAGLLEAALAEIDRRADAAGAIARIREAGDPDAELAALVAWWGDYVAGFAGIARCVYAGRSSDPELAAAWDHRMEALMGVCRTVVADCARAGRLRPGLGRPAAAELLWGLLSIPLWDQLRVDRCWSVAQYRQRLGLTVRSTLLAEHSIRDHGR